MNELSLMEKFADPQYFDSLTMGGKAAGAGITALMGMGTTFVVLILIWCVLAIMGKIMKSKNEKAAAAKAVPAPAAAPAASVATPSAVNPADDAQLVAVITAAIAAYEGSAMANNLVVKKISRVTGEGTAWSQAGSADCLASRNMIDKRH